MCPCCQHPLTRCHLLSPEHHCVFHWIKHLGHSPASTPLPQLLVHPLHSCLQQMKLAYVISLLTTLQYSLISLGIKHKPYPSLQPHSVPLLSLNRVLHLHSLPATPTPSCPLDPSFPVLQPPLEMVSSHSFFTSLSWLRLCFSNKAFPVS